LIATYIRRTLVAFWRHPPIQVGAILYASSDFFPDILPALWLKIRYLRRRVVWIQKIYHLIPSDRPIPFLAQKVSHWLIRHFADGVISLDKNLLNKLKECGFKPEVLHYNVAGIDWELISTSATSPGPAKFDAVCVGRLHRSKGIFDLPQIWAEVRKVWPEARLAIIGGTSDADVVKELRAAISDINGGSKDAIELLGYLDSQVLWPLVKSAKIFLCPSHEEGFGIAPIEGLASGLAVVAYDLPIYQSTVAGAMFLAPRFDMQAFAEKIIAAGSQINHESSKARLIDNISTTFSWDMVAKRERDISIAAVK
jgi:glycosyltransferase involved in cell wall biosynthesis